MQLFETNGDLVAAAGTLHRLESGSKIANAALRWTAGVVLAGSCGGLLWLALVQPGHHFHFELTLGLGSLVVLSGLALFFGVWSQRRRRAGGYWVDGDGIWPEHSSKASHLIAWDRVGSQVEDPRHRCVRVLDEDAQLLAKLDYDLENIDDLRRAIARNTRAEGTRFTKPSGTKVFAAVTLFSVASLVAALTIEQSRALICMALIGAFVGTVWERRWSRRRPPRPAEPRKAGVSLWSFFALIMASLVWEFGFLAGERIADVVPQDILLSVTILSIASLWVAALRELRYEPRELRLEEQQLVLGRPIGPEHIAYTDVSEIELTSWGAFPGTPATPFVRLHIRGRAPVDLGGFATQQLYVALEAKLAGR